MSHGGAHDLYWNKKCKIFVIRRAKSSVEEGGVSREGLLEPLLKLAIAGKALVFYW